MSLDLFLLTKKNPDDEQPRIWYQIKDDDVSYPVIPPTTTLVLKLLHNVPRKTLDRTFLSWFTTTTTTTYITSYTCVYYILQAKLSLLQIKNTMSTTANLTHSWLCLAEAMFVDLF